MDTTTRRILAEICRSGRLYSRATCLSDPALPPPRPGIYGWYFDELPPGVPARGCVHRRGRRLLYVGIAPSRAASRSHLRKRIRQHLAGNARGSTLRKTLGSLLADELKLVPIRTRSGGWRFKSESEEALSRWMVDHAWVTWSLCDRPWEIEHDLIHSLDLPLNLQGNAHHPFYPTLRERRAEMGARAVRSP